MSDQIKSEPHPPSPGTSPSLAVSETPPSSPPLINVSEPQHTSPILLTGVQHTSPILLTGVQHTSPLHPTPLTGVQHTSPLHPTPLTGVRVDDIVSPGGTLAEDALTPLLQALVALNPAATTGLLQSILSNHASLTTSSSTPVSRTSPVSSVSQFSTAVSSVPMSQPATSLLMPPTSFSRSAILGTSLPVTSLAATSLLGSPHPVTSLFNTSLPQLIPISSEFSSLVAAPTSTSVMASGIPTSAHNLQTSRNSRLPAGGIRAPIISSSLPSAMLANNTYSSSNVAVMLGGRGGVSSLGAAQNRARLPWVNGYNVPGLPVSTNSSLLTAPSMIDRSTTDTEELAHQSRKLADQLVAVRSRLLLSSIENSTGSGGDIQNLTKLVKLEQLIHLLQEAVAKRQAQAINTPPPSVILGGSRGNCYSGAETAGAKRKNIGKSSAQKTGKKMKHSGGSHGIQLWQFILELLGDRELRTVLCWTGNGLEFRIINSVELARLWGIRKRNPIMNFDKLSRALRYYYEKNIIKHNPMHRLVYSFCNNPDDLVYNALLNRALATCPIDPELAKLQVGDKPYQGQSTPQHTRNRIPSSIKVSLQAIRNKLNTVNGIEDEQVPLPVNNR